MRNPFRNRWKEVLPAGMAAGTPWYRTPRHLVLVALFLGLAVLEIAHGSFRLGALRDQQRAALIETVRREHLALAATLRAAPVADREHAAWVARLPALLDDEILPYLASFRGIARISRLDGQGRELQRFERHGADVRRVSADELDLAPSAEVQAAVARSQPGEVTVLGLFRREAAAGEHETFRYAARVGEGAILLEAYATPVLDAVRRFDPLAGASASLVDATGAPVAGTGAPGVPVPADLLSGVERGGPREARVDGGVLLSSLVDQDSRWFLLTFVSGRSLDVLAGPSRGESAWILGSMAAITLLLAASGLFFLRLSIREYRVREVASHLVQRQKLELQLQTAERLGSLGMLTAGVAHEINNPLEGIGNYLALLEREELPHDKRRQYLGQVKHGFGRIRDIVRELSQLSRPSVSPGTADLSAVVHQALALVRFDKDLRPMRIERHGFDQPLVVAGDPGRLEQVFVNLLLNAARVTRGQGRIEITARRLLAPDADRIEITVDDDGPGIPEENLSKIFDPFFTTTGGTGLGLPVSYGILRAHGGTLAAGNGPLGGARFTVLLPATSEPAPGQEPPA